MTEQTQLRAQAVRRRVRSLRRRRENRALSGLTMLSLLLLAGIGTLLHGVQLPGVSTVAGSYGAVLLRDGAGAYILVGIAAFAVGAALTVLCIRYRKKKENRMDRAEESEETT